MKFSFELTQPSILFALQKALMTKKTTAKPKVTFTPSPRNPPRLHKTFLANAKRDTVRILSKKCMLVGSWTQDLGVASLEVAGLVTATLFAPKLDQWPVAMELRNLCPHSTIHHMPY